MDVKGGKINECGNLVGHATFKVGEIALRLSIFCNKDKGHEAALVQWRRPPGFGGSFEWDSERPLPSREEMEAHGFQLIPDPCVFFDGGLIIMKKVVE